MRCARGSACPLAGALLGAAAAAAAGAAPPRCEAVAAVEPARAFVGQQLHYRLRILRRRDVASLEWDTPLSFPTFRAEWLPGVAEDDRVERAGETYLVFVERRALFPAHPGRLEIPAASLRCASADGEELAPIPPLVLEVDALPASGRPADFGGLVGPVEVSASVVPERLELGGSLRLSVVVQGPANVWSAGSPRAALAAVPGLEVFERPAEIARDTGRTLVLRRYLAFDLVPHAAGALRLPDVRIPYFDPVARRYAEARAFVPAVEVREAPARAPSPLPAPRRAPGAAGRPGIDLAALLLTGVGLALLALFFPRALRRALRRDAPRPRAGPAAEDPSARAARSLRAALALQLPDAAALSSEELLERIASPGAAREAALLLARIERARFSGEGAPPDPAEVERALAGLARSGR